MEDNKKIRVGLADDNQDFCDVVSDYISKQDNMELIFIAGDGLEALQLMESGKIPDVLVLDMICLIWTDLVCWKVSMD